MVIDLAPADPNAPLHIGLAVDLSNFTDPLDADTVQDLVGAGVRRCIVQAVAPGYTSHQQQVPVLRAAGIEVEGYVFIWFTDGIPAVDARVEWACNEFANLGIKMVWLDCEQAEAVAGRRRFDYVNEMTSPTIRAAVSVTYRFTDMKCGIYTAGWWWIPGTTNSTEFSRMGLPLWDAFYDGDPDIDLANYGGWTVPRMSQFMGSAKIGRVGGIDLNSYAVAMTMSLRARAFADINERLHVTRALVGGAGNAFAQTGGRMVQVLEGGAPGELNLLVRVLDSDDHGA